MLKDPAMTDETAKLSLLPNGFVDILPPKADAEAAAISTLMHRFAAFGYDRVKPPLLEFEDSLLAEGPGARLAGETFRLMDPVSHRMLGIRSDITPQIARIAASRLADAPRPLRLTYANDALRTRAGQMRTERQFTQVGCEVIGDAGLETDIEICVLAVLGLKELGVRDITLDLNIPGFVARACADMDAPTKVQIFAAVTRREQAAVAKLSPLLGGVMTKGLRAVKIPAALKADVDHLCALEDGVRAALADLQITDVELSIDVLEQAGFEYHNRFGFTLFAGGVHGELGRGGGYEVRFAATRETAKGFTLYMDTVARSLKPAAPQKRLWVPMDVAWPEVLRLQAQGWVTVRGGENKSSMQNCTHVYANGTITANEGKKS